MHRLRIIAAIAACKATSYLSKLMGKKGSSTPGSIALKICPDLLTHLSKQVKKEIIAVCGTNGKTTTNNLLYSFLKSCGYSVVCNNVGANMIYGVCCAFALSANIFGKLNADYACIEIDEASAVKVFKYFSPDKMIITNLFRDQLDRYGEIDITVKYLCDALELSPDTELILNGDDPLVAQFGENTKRKCYFAGVDEKVLDSLNETKEGRFCVMCGAKLSYEYYHYSQLGKYQCSSCSFKRPELDFAVKNVDMSDGIKWTLVANDGETPFDVNYRGFYNIYNIVLSYCAASLAAGKIDKYKEVLNRYKPQIGRMEEFSAGKKVILNLSKNPAGFNQAISSVCDDKKNKDLLIAINDNAQDGKDISWLWDVDFERLRHADINSYIICGIRVDDLAVRLKYAGIETEKLKKYKTLESAAEALFDETGEIGYALVNYTVVFKMQNILKELTEKRKQKEI